MVMVSRKESEWWVACRKRNRLFQKARVEVEPPLVVYTFYNGLDILVTPYIASV
jgi:hypothetical protein